MGARGVGWGDVGGGVGATFGVGAGGTLGEKYVRVVAASIVLRQGGLYRSKRGFKQFANLRTIKNKSFRFPETHVFMLY